MEVEPARVQEGLYEEVQTLYRVRRDLDGYSRPRRGGVRRKECQSRVHAVRAESGDHLSKDAGPSSRLRRRKAGPHHLREWHGLPHDGTDGHKARRLSLIHISEPTRLGMS